MKRFEVEINGISPLLQHKMPDEELQKLLGIKSEKIKSKEVCTPREIAQRHAYTDGKKYLLKLEYIRQAFKAASADYKMKSSTRRSYKSVAPSVFRPVGEFTPLLDEQNKPCTSFEVDIQKATNHRAGAVAVCRPRWDRWQAKFQVQIDTDVLPEETALEILESAGRHVGIGSYRIRCGGYYGAFEIRSFKQLK